VYVAPDGSQAFDFVTRAELDKTAPCPHLLLLDLNLPKLDGFEVLRRLRANERFKSLPVLVFTSSDAPADRAMAAELGASYFRKPTSYEEFLKVGSVVKELLVANGLL
jgi:DNA-binding response OmpR family regulator